MPGAVRNDDATRVQYNVNSNADQRIYDSMHGEAMMLLHKEHVLAQALPDCIDDSAGSNNQVGVTQHLLTFISVPFFKIAFEVLDNHIGWEITASLSTSRPLRANAVVGVARFTAGPAPSPSAAHRDARMYNANGSH